MPRRAIALALCAVAGFAPASAEALEPPRYCDRIVNPYEGTRYEGEDLRRIRAFGVTCRRARRVARRAHREALGMTPPPSGVRHFSWNGWHVTGDLRGDTDRYEATRGRGRRVHWIF